MLELQPPRQREEATTHNQVNDDATKPGGEVVGQSSSALMDLIIAQSKVS